MSALVPVVPATIQETTDPAFLEAIAKALLPPLELRPRAKIEIEVEAQGEGTFTFTLEPGALTAKKGFARDPFVSAVVPRGGFALVREQLQAALDGFPKAPLLARQLSALRAPKPGEVDAALAALGKLTDAAIRIEVQGAGSYVLARGAADEATHVLEVRVAAADLKRVLSGASPATVPIDVRGDRSVLTAVLAAVGPLLTRLRAA